MADVEPVEPDEWMRWRFGDSRASAGAEGSLAWRRYEFAHDKAPGLAAAARPDGGLRVFRPGSGVSLRVVLFVDDGDSELVAVVGAHEPAKQVELVLPYALEHVGDRDLVLIVPAGTEWSVLVRLAWLDQHARVFTHGVGGIVECRVPLRTEVMDEFRSERASASYALSAEHLGWVDEVVSWADGHPKLMRSDRSSYLGWQVEGRLVLRISRSKGEQLRVCAGVQSDAAAGGADRIEVVIDGPLGDPEPFREAIRRSVAARVGGADVANVEHRFQARLQVLDPVDRLGLVTFVPEYPSQRPGPAGQGPGSIDFLGVDESGRLHVMETKVGASESTVVLQALDYWLWVEANRETLADELGADPAKTAAVSVVVAPKADGLVLHRHNWHVLDRLSRSVPMKVWRADAGIDGSIRLSEAKRDAAPSVRWSDRARRRMYAVASTDGVGAGTKGDPIAGLHGAARDAAVSLAERGVLHGYVHLPHSSQRFALDLFGPVTDSGQVMELLTPYFGPMSTASSPEFEWSDPNDTLGESTSGRPSRTQVDVLLQGTTVNDHEVALLVEVKFTEPGFGGCSHAEVAPDEARRACLQPGPFGGDTGMCWQLRNRDNGQRRRYDLFLPQVDVESVDTAPCCWFRESNQPMRLMALANALVDTGVYDDCRVLLTAPAGHTSMRRRWAESVEMCRGSSQPPIGWAGEDAGADLTLLEPEIVLSVLGPEDTSFLIGRYGLGAPNGLLPSGWADPLGWVLAAELAARDPDRWSITETHPCGGFYDCLTLEPRNSDGGGGHIDINLVGSLHAWPPERMNIAVRDVWQRLARGDTGEVANWCEAMLGLLPTDEPCRREWPITMAKLAALMHGTARWRTWPYESEDNEVGPFTEIPAVVEACRAAIAGRRDRSEITIWFLVDDQIHPRAAVRLDTAQGWSLEGRCYDLEADAAAFMAAVVAT